MKEHYAFIYLLWLFLYYLLIVSTVFRYEDLIKSLMGRIAF